MSTVTANMHSITGRPEHLIVFIRDVHRKEDLLRKGVKATLARLGDLLTFTYADEPTETQIVDEISTIVQRWRRLDFKRVTIVGDLLACEVFKELVRRGIASNEMGVILFDAINDDVVRSFQQDQELRDGQGSARWTAAKSYCLEVINTKGSILSESLPKWVRRLADAMTRAFR